MQTRTRGALFIMIAALCWGLNGAQASASIPAASQAEKPRPPENPQITDEGIWLPIPARCNYAVREHFLQRNYRERTTL